MKRQKRKAKRSKGQTVEASPSAAKPKPKASRRDFLRTLSTGTLVTAVVAGGGWYLAQDVMATIREQDLSQIGNGMPAVVQIHDPQCPRCVALQREARKALSDIDDDGLQYLVANIRSAEGRQLAAEHGVSHVTLLLLDGNGRRRDVLVGPNTSEFLEQAFRRHLARYRAAQG